MALVSINYRLSTDSIWPAQMHDIFTAIRCIRQKSSVFGIDSSRVGVMGSSAGAHLTLITAVTLDSNLLGPSLGCRGRKSDVKAALSLFGPTDFFLIPAQNRLNGCPPQDSTAGQNLKTLLGLEHTNTAADSAAIAAIAPVNVIKKVPPLMMWNGDRDCHVPYQQMAVMKAAYSLKGGTAQTNVAVGSGHAIVNPAMTDSMAHWMYSILSH
jgi:acetyl esterase/lipase